MLWRTKAKRWHLNSCTLATLIRRRVSGEKCLWSWFVAFSLNGNWPGVTIGGNEKTPAGYRKYQDEGLIGGDEADQNESSSEIYWVFLSHLPEVFPCSDFPGNGSSCSDISTANCGQEAFSRISSPTRIFAIVAWVED